MTICENCGNEIRENRTHKTEIQGQQCLLFEASSQRQIEGAFSRRKLAKNLYKK